MLNTNNDPKYATGANDWSTSKEAAYSLSNAYLTEAQQDVLNFIRSCPNFRATDEMVEDALRIKYPAYSTARKRRTDLYRKGILQTINNGDDVLKWKNRNNRSMVVWEVVPAYRTAGA